MIAGIDEAGRGPLAGPVCAVSVVLPENYNIDNLKDSKKLTPKRRDIIYNELINDDSVLWSVSFINADEIDEINILQATWKAMRESFLKLKLVPNFALIDGKPVKNFPSDYKAIIGGDNLIPSISAASIIAKVQRDKQMYEYSKKYPEYGFEIHKGYGTKKHIEAINKFGPCEIHRKSFAPIKNKFFKNN